MTTSADKKITRLLDIMSKLRDPVSGCPWDKEQTFDSILPFTIEEVYEVADAIERGDMEELCDELGDLLFQIVFYTQMSREAGHFDFNDIVDNVVEKLTRRHPHVFGDRQAITTEEQRVAWERHKLDERQKKNPGSTHDSSVLDGIERGMPSFIRGVKIQRRAASAGFDWPDTPSVLEKVMEEIAEVREVLESGADKDRLLHEVGDLLMAVTNLARHVDIDPELALHQANNRFERRFRRIESSLIQQGRTLHEASLEEMETLWQQVKLQEEKPG